jgi:hypothetical protein
MKVNYINREIHDDFVRVTFIGHDARGRRRPVIDLDATDLRNLINVAKEFRQRQRVIARRYASRADEIANTGLTE